MFCGMVDSNRTAAEVCDSGQMAQPEQRLKGKSATLL
jgi:hypothetical protein